MAQPANKWWWLPGILVAIAGLVFLATAGVWGNRPVWIPVGLAFIAVSAFLVHRARPQGETT